MLLVPTLSVASERGHFAIRHAQTHLQGEELYVLSADLEYQLSEESLEALHNAVSLPLVLDIQIYRERPYWFDAHVASLQQNYRLSFRPLSQQYEVTHINTSLDNSYHTLHATLAQLGRIRNFPLLDQSLIEPDASYYVRMQSYLDIESLPAPMRPVAYLSRQWRLVSEPYTCPLEP